MQVLVLASGSQHRAQLLSRLGIEFTCLSPDIDESANADEPHGELARRLAAEKAARALELLDEQAAIHIPPGTYSTRIIIASDQVASMGGKTLCKPGTVDRACAQLGRMSGQEVSFWTSLFMLDTLSGEQFTALDVTHATLRELDSGSIARYVKADSPLDCAGSFKVESLGISLFKSIVTTDPTALIGLPMIKVCEGLRHFGLQLP